MAIVLLLLLFWLTSACQQQRPLPELPVLELGTAQKPVRKSIEAALSAARARPDDAALVARLGMTLHAHNQFAAAAKAYARAARLDPAQPDYLYYWGTVLSSDGKYSDAIAPLRAALKLRSSAPVRLQLADALYSSGKLVEARGEYEILIAADNTLAAAHYGLGRCLQGTAAASAFERAIELFPRFGAARFALAGVYRQLGQRAKADATLENYERDKLLSPPVNDPAMAAVQALDLSATGLMRASRSLGRAGRFAEAAALQERATAADPNLALAWVNLIPLYANLEQPQKAEAAYAKAIALEPKNADAHYNFGVFRAQQDRLPEAQKAFEAAIAADPGKAEALDSLGAIIEQSGAWDRAASLYRRAIAANRSLPLAHFHLGRILANQRHYPDAIREFEQSLEPASEQTPGFLYALGATHARAGATAKAIEILQRAHIQATQWQQSPLADAIERDLAKLQKHD